MSGGRSPDVSVATADTPLPVTLAVMAKEPVAGRSKTRLTPPCTPGEAAQLAEAALADTLEAVTGTRAVRHVLVLDGEPGAWVPGDVEVVAQATGPLARRVATAFDGLGGPTLMIGADTPQLTVERLDAALGTLASPDVDAVIGQATDGGYWAIGMARPVAAAFEGVPMSTSHTGRVQRTRLRQCGLRVVDLGQERDVDTITDARAVATAHPGSRFARLLRQLGLADRDPLTDAPSRR